ncbi:hypothetical protein B7L88_gp073 [Rhizobium phage RHEph10]|uniref:hypothetical protein n=1 Tax=Rhizobium phage RHEph10 TaxID=1220717 RepID=UPI0002AB0312|nr:hypothetical protein B7L88_gp073 [Rhizobium phage RHEph10]AGC36215.1 hypothetical protein RHEph10_gp172 [Rhizobium phage RHEph10]
MLLGHHFLDAFEIALGFFGSEFGLALFVEESAHGVGIDTIEAGERGFEILDLVLLRHHFGEQTIVLILVLVVTSGLFGSETIGFSLFSCEFVGFGFLGGSLVGSGLCSGIVVGATGATITVAGRCKCDARCARIHRSGCERAKRGGAAILLQNFSHHFHPCPVSRAFVIYRGGRSLGLSVV